MMDSISNFAMNNLKASKKKNILTALTIIFSTLLLTTISIFIGTMQSAEEVFFAKMGGSYHCKLTNISHKQYKLLKNNRKVDMVGTDISCNSVLSGATGDNSISVDYYDANGAKMNYHIIVKGRFPEHQNEIALESWIAKKLGVAAKVGNRVKLITNGKVKEFRICGILKENNVLKAQKQYSILVSKSYALKLGNGYQGVETLFRVKTGFDSSIEKTIFGVTDSLAMDINKDEGAIAINYDYIDAVGGNRPINKILIFLGLIVIIATVIVIYNIFYISVIDRVKQFGLLSAIGATRRQIRKAVTKEGLVLSSIGIPAGILGGILLSYVAVHFVSLLSSDGVILIFKVTPWNIFIPVVVSFLSIVLALRRPARIAAKISPMEAVRYNEAKMGKKEKRKGFSTVTVSKMSYINLNRNKKRTIFTSIAISMCGVLFIIFSSVFQLLSADSLIRHYYNHDFQSQKDSIDIYNENSKAPSPGILKKIQQIKSVKNLDMIKYHDFEVPEKYRKDMSFNWWGSFYGYSYGLINKLNASMISRGIRPKELDSDNGVVLIWRSEHKCPYKIGQKVTFSYQDYKNKNVGTKNYTVKIRGIAKNYPEFIDEYRNGPVFISSHKVFDKIFGRAIPGKVFFDADKKHYREVENKLDALDFKYEEYREVKKKAMDMIGQLEIIAMGLVTIIGIIGMINLINTMLTTMIRRKREIGMLKAIGLTRRQMNKMFILEGIFYAAISSTISVIFGNLAGYYLCDLFVSKQPWVKHNIPIMPSVMVVIIFMVVQITIISLVQRSMNKESVVEQIRYDG